MSVRFAPFHKQPSNISFSHKRTSETQGRFIIFLLLTGILFLILILRLFQLTITKGAYYLFISEKNRVKELAIPARRGVLYDRKKEPIAYSKEENSRMKRVYPFGASLSHVVGFLQIASPSDFKQDACKISLSLNDTIGKSGTEHIFECDLRGKKGKKLVQINAQGKKIKTLAKVLPQHGQNITLSLDARLQQKAQQIIEKNAITTNQRINLAEKKIAIVASNPKTGEILLILSYPSFDPNLIQEKPSRLLMLQSDPNKPLFNRALQGLYPPGSTFKLVVASAALEEGVIDEDFEVEDTGVIKAGPLEFGNWYFLQYGKTEGMVSITKAIKRSNDIFFYRVGEKVGPEMIKKWAHRFEIGKPTELGLWEKNGFIPSPFWKREVKKEAWYLGDTYNTSIGQGYITTTPLEINRLTQAIAHSGVLCKPTIQKVTDTHKPQCANLHITFKTLALIKKGMTQACASGGTAWPFFEFKVNIASSSALNTLDSHKPTTDNQQVTTISVACKTGTSESHMASGLPHAWFTAYAPSQNPEIVITVLVEESGEGSNIAAPIAKEILKYYFERTD